jgi:hypothetical protein
MANTAWTVEAKALEKFWANYKDEVTTLQPGFRDSAPQSLQMSIADGRAEVALSFSNGGRLDVSLSMSELIGCALAGFLENENFKKNEQQKLIEVQNWALLCGR